jgi:hypothetical protein
MNPHGSLSIERNHALSSRARWDGYLIITAVGVLAGVLTAYARAPMHLPGHKALWWMAPVLACRLATRTTGGASVGALAAAMTILCLGGRLGGAVMVPLMVAAGIVLDLGVRIGQQRRFPGLGQIFSLGLAGAAANLVCFGNRLADPIGPFNSTLSMHDALVAAGSHVLFGFAAGLLGAAAGFALAQSSSKRNTASSPEQGDGRSDTEH